MRICAIYDGCCVALRRHRRRGKALKSKKLEGLIEIVIVFLKIDCEGHRVCRSVFRPSSILQRSCVRISVITDAYKTRVNFSLFLFLFLFSFFHSLSSKNCFQIFFLIATTSLWIAEKTRVPFVFFSSSFLSFFLCLHRSRIHVYFIWICVLHFGSSLASSGYASPSTMGRSNRMREVSLV